MEKLAYYLLPGELTSHPSFEKHLIKTIFSYRSAEQSKNDRRNILYDLYYDRFKPLYAEPVYLENFYDIKIPIVHDEYYVPMTMRIDIIELLNDVSPYFRNNFILKNEVFISEYDLSITETAQKKYVQDFDTMKRFRNLGTKNFNVFICSCSRSVIWWDSYYVVSKTHEYCDLNKMIVKNRLRKFCVDFSTICKFPKRNRGEILRKARKTNAEVYNLLSSAEDMKEVLSAHLYIEDEVDEEEEDESYVFDEVICRKKKFESKKKRKDRRKN